MVDFPFLRLPTVLQHMIWSFAPRRALLLFPSLSRAVCASASPLARAVHDRSAGLTRREVRRWLARLESISSVMRERTLRSSALSGLDFALLFVSAVPAKAALQPGLDPLSAVPKSRAYTGDSLAPPRRALKKLIVLSEALSRPPAADGSGGGGTCHSIPVILHPNVTDSLSSTPLPAVQPGALRSILAKVRWVLRSNAAVWAEGLLGEQRARMEGMQQAHEDALNSGQESSFDYCDASEAFSLALLDAQGGWERDIDDFLFELKYVLRAVLDQAASTTGEGATTAGATEQKDDASSRAAAALASSAALALASSTQPLLFHSEAVHINDASQDLVSDEGEPYGRYTRSLFVVPLVKTLQETEEESQVKRRVEEEKMKALERHVEALRVKAMLARFDAPSEKAASLASSASAPQDPHERLEQLRRDHAALETLAAFKGVPVPPAMADSFASSFAQVHADIAKDARRVQALRDGEDAEFREQSIPQSERHLLYRTADPSADVGATKAAAAAEIQLEGFDLPYFFIAATHFRDERRANNSRRVQGIR